MCELAIRGVIVFCVSESKVPPVLYLSYFSNHSVLHVITRMVEKFSQPKQQPEQVGAGYIQ